jgi:hypothetical protein
MGNGLREPINVAVAEYKVQCDKYTTLDDLEKVLKECEAAMSIINKLKQATKKKMFKNHGKKWTNEHREHLMQLYKGGLSEKEMRLPLGRDIKGIEYEITKYLVNEQQLKNMSLEQLAKKYNKEINAIAQSIDLGHKKH